jgi:hypothetical protein
MDGISKEDENQYELGSLPPVLLVRRSLRGLF